MKKIIKDYIPYKKFRTFPLPCPPEVMEKEIYSFEAFGINGLAFTIDGDIVYLPRGEYIGHIDDCL